MKNRKKLITTALLISATYFSQSASAAEVTRPALDGMVLELGNVVQRVKVRAKSMGPGGCEVRFSVGGEQAGFIALPGIWSKWVEVGPAFLGSTAVKFGFNQLCDTDAIAEVRFFDTN